MIKINLNIKFNFYLIFEFLGGWGESAVTAHGSVWYCQRQRGLASGYAAANRVSGAFINLKLIFLFELFISYFFIVFIFHFHLAMA